MQAYGLLGQLYLSQNSWIRRAPSSRQIAQQHPKAVGRTDDGRDDLEAQGKRAEARRRYEQVLQMDRHAPVAANNLAYIYAEHGGNLDVALQLAQTAKAALPDVA